MIRYSISLAAAVVSLLACSAASAQNIPAYVTAAVNDKGRPVADTMRDADRKPAETAAFSTVKPGDKVLELIAGGGYFTRILSKTVGPTGHVYATVAEAFLAARPQSADGLKAVAADPAYPNVTMVVQATGKPAAPEPVDVVWTTLNYHDLHNPGAMGAGDMDAFNKSVFTALKPGGVFFVVDHASAKGTGFTQTGTLHRIEPDAAKAEILKAGFVFDGESKALTRDEPHTAHSDDKDDMFIFRFRKPR